MVIWLVTELDWKVKLNLIIRLPRERQILLWLIDVIKKYEIFETLEDSHINLYGNLLKIQNAKTEFFIFGYKKNHKSRKNEATA